jgi:hypothetical protein
MKYLAKDEYKIFRVRYNSSFLIEEVLCVKINT